LVKIRLKYLILRTLLFELLCVLEALFLNRYVTVFLPPGEQVPNAGKCDWDDQDA
jgi:hypothetical protein